MRQHNIWCVCVRAFCVERYAGLMLIRSWQALIFSSVFPSLGDTPNFPPVYNDRNTKLLFARIIY